MTVKQITARLHAHTKLVAANDVQKQKAIEFFTHALGTQPKPTQIDIGDRDKDAVAFDVKMGSVSCKVVLATLNNYALYIYVIPGKSGKAAKDVDEMFAGMLAHHFDAHSFAITSTNARGLVKSFAQTASTLWNGYNSRYNSPEYVAKHYRAGERPREVEGVDKKDFDEGVSDTLKKWSTFKL